ncbi:MAG TPA: 50S ribosomal protein L6 [Blastocatellia bacterium]|nr:50S ribosomal protein L6 [Blastocatellia bacterium]HMV85137.1 50S ribosomal protein L6 [Blastocatellia bacterium]HMX25665.1 50S ribosomal protein L6 [Blastocatellia bacterium]HMY75495.1 50S ribosomal protein L6 [Blastocatellia bacterium]HMZ18616.1 50S ribosomal protein L6 [Blastocatellia bacterium]
MSRVGKKPIEIPNGVKVNITDSAVEVQGPKGKLSAVIPAGVTLKVEDGKLIAERKDDSHTAMHGTTRALVANAIKGVSQGFTQEMDVVGVGYKAELKGRSINLALGYSHPIEFVLPEGITAKIEKLPRTITQYQTTITLSGIDRETIGQVAANMNRLRKPDAYKGKGIRYANRPMKLKPGKTGK